jgi:hypothetical protein
LHRAWLEPEGLGPCRASARSSPVLSLNSTRKVPGAPGPTARTVHSPPSEARLWKYISSFLCAEGTDSASRTRSGDGGLGLEAMAVGVWLGWVAGGSGTRLGQVPAKAKARPALRVGQQSFSFASLEGPPCSRQTRLPLSGLSLCGHRPGELVPSPGPLVPWVVGAGGGGSLCLLGSPPAGSAGREGGGRWWTGTQVPGPGVPCEVVGEAGKVSLVFLFFETIAATVYH